MSAAPPASPVADAFSGALVTIFGPWGAVAALAYRFGSPWVAKLIKNAAEGKDPTAQEWADLEKLIETPGETLIPKRPGA